MAKRQFEEPQPEEIELNVEEQVETETGEDMEVEAQEDLFPVAAKPSHHKLVENDTDTIHVNGNYQHNDEGLIENVKFELSQGIIGKDCNVYCLSSTICSNHCINISN